MSEAEKEARRLVYLYSTILIDFPYKDSQNGRCIGTNCMTFNSAKKFALIAVDEKMRALSDVMPHGVDWLNKVSELNKVKAEIEKM